MQGMKDFLVKFETYHETYNGYDHCDGWSEYRVSARNSKSAVNKAKKLWKGEYHSAYWINFTSIMELKNEKRN